MRIIILIVFVLITITGFSVKNNETKGQVVQHEYKTYPEIKINLNQFCYECSKQSIEKFKIALTDMEEYVQSHEDEIFYNKGVDGLLQGYKHIVLMLDLKEKVEVEEYIEKIYKSTSNQMKLQNNLMSVTSILRDTEKQFKNIIKNQKIKEPTRVSYEKMLIKLSSKSRDIINVKLNGKTMREYYKTDFQHLKKPDRTLNSMKPLQKRIEYFLLNSSDQAVLEEYINILKNFKNYKKIINNNELNIILKVLSKYISTNQVNQQTIQELRRALILASTQEINTELYNDIIWWCEARNNINLNSHLEFLDNQIPTQRNNDAIQIFVELGEVEKLLNWSKNVNFENSEIIFKLAIRRANLRKENFEDKMNLAKLFNNEYKHSIAEIIQQKQQDNKIYQDHIRWLIIQIGTHIKKDKFKKTLENLTQDNLFYNKKLTNDLSTKEKQDLREALEEQFKISSDAEFLFTLD